MNLGGKKCGRIGCWIQFSQALTISLLLRIVILAFISCFTFLNFIFSYLQALIIPLLLLVAALSSANTGGFFAYHQQMDFTLRGNYQEFTFCRDKNNGRFKPTYKRKNAGVEYDYHEEDQPTQSSEPVQVLCWKKKKQYLSFSFICIYHLLYEVKHLLKFRF